MDAGGDQDGGIGLDASGLDAAEQDAGCVPPDDDPFGCEDFTPDPSCDASWVVGVTGRIETAAGDGVDAARPQLCLRVAPDDILVCLVPPMTEPDGSYAIVIPPDVRCLDRAAMRAIAPGRMLATTYCPVEVESASSGIVAADPYVLHPVEAGTVPPIGDETEPREVVFPDGLSLTLRPDDVPTSDDYLSLSGAPVDVAATECFADSMVFDGAYVFRPEVPVQMGAVVSIPNTEGLAPGTVVDLWVLGGLETNLLDGTEVEEGELGQIGTATVTADGSAMVSDELGRVPYLSWLVWRRR